MLANPGVGRRRAFVPDVQGHAGENDFVSLAARTAAQTFLVPVDPDIPVLFSRQSGFEIGPCGAHPFWRARRPEWLIAYRDRPIRFDASDVTTDCRPDGGFGGAAGSAGDSVGGAGDGFGGAGGAGDGVGGAGGGGGKCGKLSGVGTRELGGDSGGGGGGSDGLVEFVIGACWIFCGDQCQRARPTYGAR